ncbi:MAG: MFS transporter, partial [Ilumatobacteraceae bacterium]
MTSARPVLTRLDRQQRQLAVGLVLGVTMVAFEITAVLTTLPTITDQLHGDSLYGVALACYTLANLVALVVTGELTDRYGPAKPYLGSLAVFAAGLVVAATAPSMTMVVIGRTLQGAGTGGLAPIAYVLVKRVFPTDRQPSMYAYLSAGWVLPSLVAPAIAGTITDQFGWRWVFWLLLPLIPVVAFITVRPMRAHVSTGTGEVRHSRIGAAVLAAAGIGAFVTSLQFKNPFVAVGGALGGLIVGVPSLRRLLPAGVLRAARGLPAVVACRMIATAAFLGADSFIPLAADRIHGASPTLQGFTIIGASLSWTAGQWLISRRPDVD